MRAVLTEAQFLATPHGRWFGLVFQHEVGPELLRRFSSHDWQRRMEEAELHHDRPALAGVLWELSFIDEVDGWSRWQRRIGKDGRRHLAQFIGAVVRQVMEARGWCRTGRKGSLEAIGGGVVRKAERYMPPESHEQFDLWAERHPDWAPLTTPASSERKPQPTGPTRAQQIRDLIDDKSNYLVALHLRVAVETVTKWRRQAERDDGREVRGRSSQPRQVHLDGARRCFGPAPELGH